MPDVTILTHTRQADWDAYLETSKHATPFQLWHWKNIFERSFGFNTVYLSALRQNRIVGVLPMIFVHSRLLGNYLTSMPGGIAADDPEAQTQLLETAMGLVQEHGLQYLALRDSTQMIEHPALVTDREHVSMRIDMGQDFQEVVHKITRTTRQQANKAQRADIHTELDRDALKSFYPIYLRAMREHGTPTQGLDFFENVSTEFPERFQLMVIKQKERILGGGFIFMFNGHMVCTWSGLLRKYLPLKTSYLLIWDTVELAHKMDLKWVDLGRSQVDSGTFQHKKQWGAEPVQLYQQYFLNKSHQAASTGNARNEKPLFKVFVAAWRLLPLPITEFLGPKLRSQVPFG